MIRAAGILIISNRGNALFLKRGPGGDAPGLWCVPGGRIEGDELPIDAAIRETLEETGGFKARKDDLKAWSRTVTPREGAPLTPPPAGVDGDTVEFTTFALTDVDEFAPDIAKSGEHVAHAWAPLNEPPEPLHPGVRLSLAKFGMHELDIARAIADGRFASPQRYENLWLFAIRITGTGMAYRRALDEFVWRDASLYLNQDFLDRCAGLPVIWEHPAGNVLDRDGKEYRERVIGAVMFAYVVGDEVWAIARINDGDAAKEMDEGSSTSPAVVWRDASVNTELQIDGKRFLVEGKPSLLDHIAICPLGVWDKGRRPSGVATTASRGDSEMLTKEELEKMLADEAKKRADEAQASQKVLEAFASTLKSVADSVKAVSARLDSEDEKKRSDAAKRRDGFKFSKRGDGEDDDKYKERHDAEEAEYADACRMAGDSDDDAKKKAADARRDAEEEEKGEVEREKADRARKDAEEEAKKKEAADRSDSAALKARADALEQQLAELRGQVVARSDADTNALADVQARADAIEMAYGRRARAPLVGESVVAYKRHFAKLYQSHHPKYKDKDMTAVSADAEVFDVVFDSIIDAATAAARNPARGAPGTVTMVTRRSDSGHMVNEFHGSTVWMNRFAGPVRQHVKRFRDKDDTRGRAVN